eukprot:Clim_evm4s235 gene=Clim_evmTU4s235
MLATASHPNTGTATLWMDSAVTCSDAFPSRREETLRFTVYGTRSAIDHRDIVADNLHVQPVALFIAYYDTRSDTLGVSQEWRSTDSIVAVCALKQGHAFVAADGNGVLSIYDIVVGENYTWECVDTLTHLQGEQVVSVSCNGTALLVGCQNGRVVSLSLKQWSNRTPNSVWESQSVHLSCSLLDAKVGSNGVILILSSLGKLGILSSGSLTSTSEKSPVSTSVTWFDQRTKDGQLLQITSFVQLNTNSSIVLVAGELAGRGCLAVYEIVNGNPVERLVSFCEETVCDITIDQEVEDCAVLACNSGLVLQCIGVPSLGKAEVLQFRQIAASSVGLSVATASSVYNHVFYGSISGEVGHCAPPS